MTKLSKIDITEKNRASLEKALKSLIKSIGPIKIGTKEHFPYGWGKAAKGRTVWRIIEEIINQNLKSKHKDHNIEYFSPSDSEVGVFDFSMRLNDLKEEVYVNIKSSVIGNKSSKDDISKAVGLLDFYQKNENKELFIATFIIRFIDNPPSVVIDDVVVMPTAWLSDVYVNPSNNGNLQSATYKNISSAIQRSNEEFIKELENAYHIALDKKRKKNQ